MKRSDTTRLSAREAFELFAHWRSASTTLSLILVSGSSSFKGTVRVLESKFPLILRFTWLLDGPDNAAESIGVSLVDPDIFEETKASETRPRSLVCRCKSDLAFVLVEIPKGGDFKEFDVESLLVQ